MGAFIKSDRITSSGEFKALPADVREFFRRETVPHYELAANFPAHFVFPDIFSNDYSYVSLAVFLMNAQPKGEAQLQSSNADDPLLFDPKFLSHPVDRRACIDMHRHAFEVSRLCQRQCIHPARSSIGDSDEDILEFCKNHLSPGYHLTGTAKMGKSVDKDAAVDSKFRVFGTESLRVADMSVVPLLTNNHCQSPAYVTGVTCAEALIKEYGLDME